MNQRADFWQFCFTGSPYGILYKQTGQDWQERPGANFSAIKVLKFGGLMNKNRHNFVQLIFSGMLLIIMPSVCSLLLFLHVIDGQRGKSYREAAEMIEERARDLFANLDPEKLFTPRFQQMATQILPLIRQLETETDTESQAKLFQKIRDCYQTTAKTSGEDFQLYLFNTAGQLIKTGMAPEKTNSLMQHIWNGLNYDPGVNPWSRSPEMAQVLGKDFRIQQALELNNRCLATDNSGKDGLFFHKKPANEKYGLIAFVEPNSDSSMILFTAVENATAESAPILLQTGNKIKPVSNSDFPANEAFALAEKHEQAAFIFHDFLWKQFRSGGKRLLFGQSFSPARFLYMKLAAGLFIVLLIFLGMLHLYRSFFSQESVWISIRIKLTGIFIFAVYLPILGLFMLGYNGLNDRKAVLENEARKGILELLFEIDSGFVKKERQIHATFEGFFRNTGWHSSMNKDFEEQDKAVRAHNNTEPGGENFFNWVDIRDIEQNQLYSNASTESNDRLKAMGRTMSLICLEKVMPERLQQAGVKLRQSDLVLVNLLENPILGFSNLFEQPGRLIPMDIEGSRLYWYWNYYDDPKSPVAYFIGNADAKSNIVRYLGDILKKRYSLGATALKIVAFLPGDKKWFGIDGAQDENLHNLFRICMRSGKVEEANLEHQGERYLATCLPGIKLHQFYTACLFPVAEIDTSIANLRSQIYLVVALILIVAVLTGLLLSKTFLQPIAELDLGLQALRRRDTDFRVEISNQDELGDLGRVFNQMMLEIKEMLLAGAVQHCLISARCPPVDGFECLIYNRMAADVGGDYADMFVLPDQRYLIVLGDVTGHGVSSSILTAMVKAAVFRFASYDTDLKTILKSLSSMILDLLKRRKLMTFCAMILDGKNGQFKLANAGHPFPLLCSEGGSIRQIEHASLPLGVSDKRSNYEIVDGEIAPGELMMFYTDGITEGTDPAGTEFGLPRVEAIVSRRFAEGIESVRDCLLQDFFSHYRRQELDDDLTFILVRRLNAAAK